MPAVAIHCPLCTGVIQIDSSYAGQQVTCPLCQGLLSIPDESVLLGDAPQQTPHLPPEFPPSEYPGAPGTEVVQLGCPICAGEFQVPLEMGGQQVGCPHCNNLVTLPQFEPQGGPTIPKDVDSYLPPGVSEPQVRPPAPLPPVETRERFAPPARPQREQRINPAPLAPTPKPNDDRSAPSRDRGQRSKKHRKTSPVDDLLPPGAAPLRKPAASDPADVDSMLPPAAVPADIDQLLPPGAGGSTAPSIAADASAAPRPMVVDTLLPPGALSAEIGAAAQQVALPKAPVRMPKPPANVPPGAIVVPTPEGEFVTVQETATKVIMAGNQAIEVRKLTPKEKAKRRMWKNIIMGIFCLAIMFVVLLILMNK